MTCVRRSLVCARAVFAAAIVGGIAPRLVAQGAPPIAPPHAELPIKHAPQPTTSAITPEDLMTRLYIFADDSMQGREAGQPGHVRGTEYIVRELTRLHVKPMGESGGYYQMVPMVTSRLDMAHAVLSAGTALAPGKDFQPLPGILGLPFPVSANVSGAPVVFGGRLGAADAIKPADAKGKLVVMLAVIDPRNGQPSFQVWGASDKLQSYREAAGVIVASLELTPPSIIGYLTQEDMQLRSAAPKGPADFPPVAVVTQSAAKALLGFAPDSAAVGAAGAAGAASFTFGFAETPPPSPTRNVVAVVEGSDPRLKGEYIAVSAHSDHIGVSHTPVEHDSLRFLNQFARPMGADNDPPLPVRPEDRARVAAEIDSVRHLRAPRPDSISNGADDDGTGSMGLLELAEYFQSLPQKPKRSILFVWNVAEEKGLFGSEWFTEHPTVPRDSIVADINIDMIGRGSAGDIENGGPNYLQILGSRRLSTEYGEWIEEVNKRPEFSFKFDYQFDANGHPQQYYCRSDHWNFARWGIPTVFFSTGSHEDYHQVTDEPQYIDYSHYAKVVHFVGALAADVAARPNRPVVDKPKPDPHGRCVQ